MSSKDQWKYREDLFYRLNVFPIVVPPHRDRKEDIEALAQAFVEKFSRKLGRRISPLSEPILEGANITRALEAAGWKVSGANGAAALLQMNVSTLNSRMRALGIRRPRSS